MPTSQRTFTLMIASPLEESFVSQIRAAAPSRVRVIHEPELMPPTRYVADHKGPEDYQRAPQLERRWRSLLQEADILFDFPVSTIGDGSFQAVAPNVRWVQSTSSGIGQLVKKIGLQNTDVIVTNAGGVHATPLAEFVLMSLLIHAKRLHHLQSEQRQHRWQRFCGDDLEGKTLAIVGLGQVGRRIAALARNLGMRVIAFTRDVFPGREERDGVDAVYPPERLPELIGQAYGVVLALPQTPETEGLIDARTIAAMQDGVVFINIARGICVDQNALLSALRSGRVGFAAMDVTDPEPLPPESPLWELPNVLISPHSASTSFSENGKIVEIFRHNLQCYLDGRLDDMRNVFNKERLY
jgi:phosphoglycerate dehydrogenase-like enzyme